MQHRMKKQPSDFREKAAHGDTMLPVSYYCSRIPEDFRHFSLHWHEEAEITYIGKGSADYTINFHTSTVREGDLLLLSPQVLHGAAERDGNTMTSHSLVFHLNFLGCLTPDACTIKYLNPLLTGKYRFTPILSPGQPGYNEIRRLFLEACREFNEKDTAYELRTKARLTELLSELYCNGYIEKTERDTGSLHAEEKLKEILTHIQNHFSEPLSIHDLATVCHFSETYLMNFFRKHTGTTCVEYINRCRLSRAAAALEETDLPIMDIALESGFRNVSYFNKLFKNRFGRTPGEYRAASHLSI
ncbi:MAG: AraC family transcriptional regulator [Clostridiales bacterium]|nr:AraC family transcriptional regulator [Clostridiales bacterium]